MINSQEIKIGTCIRLDGKIWTCIDFQHRKPGKGNTVMITKLKNVADGRVLERTFQVGFKLEDVRVERRPYQYLYEDSTGYIFMNQETFEQIPISKHQITGSDYMKEGDVVEVVTDTSDGTILLAEMPVKTTLTITHSEPGVRVTLQQTQQSLLRLRLVLLFAFLSSSTRVRLSRLTLAMVATWVV